MTKIKKIKVAPGITWVEIPLAETYILCGTPADSVKHLIKNGMIQNIEKEIFWDLLRMLFQNVYTNVCILWLMILNVRRDLHEIQKVLFTDFTRLSGFWNAQGVPKQIWQGGYANGWTSIGAFDRGEASNQPVKD